MGSIAWLGYVNCMLALTMHNGNTECTKHLTRSLSGCAGAKIDVWMSCGCGW